MLSMRSVRAQGIRAAPVRAPKNLFISAPKRQAKLRAPTPFQPLVTTQRRFPTCRALSFAPEVDHSSVGQIPGIQSFVASIKDRRSHVPAAYYKNPLQRIFTRFDDDADGFLTTKQVWLALSGHGIDVTEAQVHAFLSAAELQLSQLQIVSFEEFEALVYTMAEVDLANNGLYVNW